MLMEASEQDAIPMCGAVQGQYTVKSLIRQTVWEAMNFGAIHAILAQAGRIMTNIMSVKDQDAKIQNHMLPVEKVSQFLSRWNSIADGTTTRLQNVRLRFLMNNQG